MKTRETTLKSWSATRSWLIRISVLFKIRISQGICFQKVRSARVTTVWNSDQPWTSDYSVKSRSVGESAHWNSDQPESQLSLKSRSGMSFRSVSKVQISQVICCMKFRSARVTTQSEIQISHDHQVSQWNLDQSGYLLRSARKTSLKIRSDKSCIFWAYMIQGIILSDIRKLSARKIAVCQESHLSQLGSMA